ncbi:beta-ketoacyl synthase N-terminal-like domain-containing protein [Chitinophaga sp. CF418]|uniref:beta-ketoacyl synthase N-terminal-like domain-containing protein n=1 Tax=Chitinophaga sp. CF418 TaxID=1855287 RepID=UPI00091B5385|nr:beta-ketoacyl synthase N-terminal-like domain-containing protein [Chitinophaga sp. CF418]SHN77720.1 3-oxoacyl-(acyl-carrier-protein) synthase [Chitinophaga sp. CF418]
MYIYIQGTGCVSPQETAAGNTFPAAVLPWEGPRLKAWEPDYKQWIDVKLIRRMSRVIKMGVAAAKLSLQEAGVEVPDAIITGTAYGCLDDTGVFLSKMINQQEEMLTPTAFIQSTHNTVAGQIALMLGCHAYNNTFVHKAFSFESALLDSIMILREGRSSSILAGAMDELTNHSFNILSRFDLYKKEPVTYEQLLKSSTHGTVAGEGAACFALGTEKGPNTKAKLTGLTTLYKPVGKAEISPDITSFLAAHNCSQEEVSLVITGRNGDASGDEWYEYVENTLFAGKPVAGFKHLCGEYPTAASFGMWLGNRILAEQQVPADVLLKGKVPEQIKKVLIYNHHKQTHHSLILLTAC